MSVAGLLGRLRAHIVAFIVSKPPRFRMPVSENHVVAPIMPVRRHRRHIKPNMPRRVSRERAVVDATLVFVDENPDLRWPRQVRILHIEWDVVHRAGRENRRVCRPRAHH